MKVFIISSVPIPNGMASTKRIKCLARAIKDSGLEVEVITYIRTEHYGKNPNNTEGRGLFNEIPYWYTGGTPIRSSNVFLRRFNDYFDKKTLLTYLKNEIKLGDVVYMYDGNNWDFSVRVAKLVHERNAFYVKDLCELPYGDNIETDKRRENREKSFKYEFPLIDAITPISEGLLEIAKKYTNRNCHFLKVPILVDFDEYRMEDESSRVDCPYIFHSGTLTEQKDGILGIIRAFGEFHKSVNSNLKFISTGYLEKSIHAQELKTLIEYYKIEKYVSFVGFLPENELKDYLKKASIVIINKYKNMQNQCCFSTKLGEYLAACKPVIVTDYGEAVNWVKNEVTAYVVPTGNDIALMKAIQKILNEPKEAMKVAKQGQNLCKKSFDYKSWGKPIRELFESL